MLWVSLVELNVFDRTCPSSAWPITRLIRNGKRCDVKNLSLLW